MPARSQAQRAYLNYKFGHEWVRKHHFDNPGRLPARAPKPKGKRPTRAQITRRQMTDRFARKHRG